jgi:hypothetical protein
MLRYNVLQNCQKYFLFYRPIHDPLPTAVKALYIDFSGVTYPVKDAFVLKQHVYRCGLPASI